MKTLRITFAIFTLSIIICLIILIQSRNVTWPWQGRRKSDVYTTLVETSEVSLLQTAEFRMKVLFPYDFIKKGDEVNWQFLQRYYDYAPDEYGIKSSAGFYPEKVLPEEWKYASLYALCRENGMDPAGRFDSFVVISTVSKAGFNFSDGLMNLEVLPESEGETKKIVLTLPSPEITDIIIEDRSVHEGGFPEVSMTPGQWSRFITDLKPEITELALQEGILSMAEESAVFLLKDLFGGAGFEIQRIDFSN